MNSFVMANPHRCIGCRTCEIACVVAHSENNIFLEEGNDEKFNPCLKVIKTLDVTAPVQCRHCENAPCANACPNGSIINKDGVIIINKETCIGCKTCAMVCPFGAIDMVTEYNDKEKVLQEGLKSDENGNFEPKEKIVANKCDLCIGREKGPACIEACPTNALNLIKYEKIDEAVSEKRKNTAKGLIMIS